ncbi:MAG: VWA domain-containing protein [Ktedonobacteraceae bacterium]|nr:VWA domain-containing protein [Ktedonobacteraceae bacterium]
MYMQPATALTPALVIYLIDASNSMNERCGQTSKIDVVNKALLAAMKDMVRQSLRDQIVRPRYKIAIFAYSTEVIDVLHGIRTITELVPTGTPTIVACGQTNTESGFAAVERLLQIHLQEFENCPAPLVCHLTDALLNTGDPQPIVQRIKAMQVADGPVLVENVYVADNMLRKSVRDWRKWPGVHKADQLTNEYAKLLYSMSSPLPELYRQNINNAGYNLQSGAALFFPGLNSDLVRLAFAISAVTQHK